MLVSEKCFERVPGVKLGTVYWEHEEKRGNKLKFPAIHLLRERCDGGASHTPERTEKKTKLLAEVPKPLVFIPRPPREDFPQKKTKIDKETKPSEAWLTKPEKKKSKSSR